MSFLAAVLTALVPVALLIALGYALRRNAFVDDGFWPQAERVCYYVLLPALFIHGLSTAELGALPIQGLAGSLIGATVVVAALVAACRPLVGVDGPAFTSIFQGSIRFNNYVGLSLSVGIFGAQGLAAAAICNAALVPLVNLLSILAFAGFGRSRLNAGAIVRQIAFNPLIVSCCIGAAMQAAGIRPPIGIEPTLKSLGAASMPLGLLCVGAALRFDAIGSWKTPVFAASAARFIVMPSAMLLAARAFGLDGTGAVVALLFHCLPTASSSYILARQLGGDAPLMAGITAAQTLLAGAAIPLVLTVWSLGLP